MIIATLDQLEERKESAITKAMQQAQIRLSRGISAEAQTDQTLIGTLRKIQPHPYWTISAKYDDNVDTVAQDKKGSLDIQNTLGLKMNAAGKGRISSLDINIDTRYCHNRPRNHNQGANIDLENNFSLGRYNLKLSDSYYNNYIASDNFIKEDDSDFKRHGLNTFSTGLGRDFNRTGFNLGYTRADYFYERNFRSENNHAEERYSWEQYLKIATKTRLFFEYEYYRKTYPHDTTSDSHYHDLNLSLAGVLSAKLTGLAKIGYKLTDNYADEDSGDATGYRSRETELGGTVSYKFSPFYSDINLSFVRTIHEDSNRPAYYTENKLQISGNRRLAFNPKFNFTFGGGILRAYYPKRIEYAKKNNTYTVDLGLAYSFKQWLDFSLDYNWKKYSSNVDTDYKNNIFTFKTQAKF